MVSLTLLLLTLLANAGKLPDAPSKAAVVRVCGACHPAEVVIGTNNTRQGWADLVDDMLFKGGKATPRERRDIIDYLSRHFPMRRD